MDFGRLCWSPFHFFSFDIINLKFSIPKKSCIFAFLNNR